MRKNKRSLTPLLIGIFALLLILFFSHTFSPSYFFSFNVMKLSSIIPFLILFFLTLFGFAGFVLKSTPQGILAGSFGVLFLLLRMFSFTHWFFTLLLVTFFAVVELMMLQKS